MNNVASPAMERSAREGGADAGSYRVRIHIEVPARGSMPRVRYSGDCRQEAGAWILESPGRSQITLEIEGDLAVFSDDSRIPARSLRVLRSEKRRLIYENAFDEAEADGDRAQRFEFAPRVIYRGEPLVLASLIVLNKRPPSCDPCLIAPEPRGA